MTGPIAEAASTHAANAERRELVVHEWIVAGEPVTIYADKVPLSVSSKIAALAEGDMAKIWCFTLIYCAKDKEGNRMFSHGHLQMMMDEWDGDVVARIAQWLRTPSEITPEEREKN